MIYRYASGASTHAKKKTETHTKWLQSKEFKRFGKDNELFKLRANNIKKTIKELFLNFCYRFKVCGSKLVKQNSEWNDPEVCVSLKIY